MITESNFKEEYSRLNKEGLLDKEAKDLCDAMLELLPYYNDAPEVKKEFDLCCDAVNENAELNRKAKGGSASSKSDNAAAIRKRKIAIKLKLQLQLAAKR